MENLVHSSTKSRSIQIPVAKMVSPESEVSENTIYTRPNSLESALPRIKSAHCLSDQPYASNGTMRTDQQVRSKSFSFSGAGKEMRKSENSIELPDVQKRRCLVSFPDLQQTEKTNTAKDSIVPERPFKVSKLLEDRIRVLEDALQKHLTAAKESILQAKVNGKQERATASGNSRGGSVNSLQSGKESTKRLEGVEGNKHSAQKKGKRLRKPSSESSASTDRTHSVQSQKEPLETKGKHIVSLLKITEQTTEGKDGNPAELNHIVNEDGLSSKSILKQRKHGSSRPDNLTKTVNKTIRLLYKLNKVNEAENLSDLLESKLMTEKELNKAIKRELQEEREEKKRMEAKSLEKSRREAFFHKMEELERMEEEMRETRMREREKRRAEAQKRREKNIALWNEKQKSILSSKISRAFKFSYFPLLMHDSTSSSSDEQSSSEDSDNGSSVSSESVSRQNSVCGRCASTTNNRKNRNICSSHSKKKTK